MDGLVAGTDLLIQLNKDSFSKEWLDEWENVYNTVGIITAVVSAPDLVRSLLRGGLKLYKSSAAGAEEFFRAALLRIILDIQTANFTGNTVQNVKRINIGLGEFKYTSQLAGTAKKLRQYEVTLIELLDDVGKAENARYLAIYDGATVASGTKAEVKSALSAVVDAKSTTTAKDILNNLAESDIPRIRAAMEELNITSPVKFGFSRKLLDKLKRELKKLPKFDMEKNALAINDVFVDFKISDRALCPDFLGSTHLFPIKSGQKNVVKIILTGSRSKDFRLARKLANIELKEYETFYTWHHLDDFDPTTGTCSMQLVDMRIHGYCNPHRGGGKLWDLLYGPPFYKKKK